MRLLSSATALPAIALIASSAIVAAKEKPTTLQIGVKKRIPESECTIKSQNGDRLSMHYTGLTYEGVKFDSSLDRGDPFEFTIGSGQVIKGWDYGLLDMCIGEKRKLQIPPDLGYGDRGAGAKIPGGTTLVFDVELLGIDGARANALRGAAEKLIKDEL